MTDAAATYRALATRRTNAPAGDGVILLALAAIGVRTAEAATAGPGSVLAFGANASGQLFSFGRYRSSLRNA